MIFELVFANSKTEGELISWTMGSKNPAVFLYAAVLTDQLTDLFLYFGVFSYAFVLHSSVNYGANKRKNHRNTVIFRGRRTNIGFSRILDK